MINEFKQQMHSELLASQQRAEVVGDAIGELSTEYTALLDTKQFEQAQLVLDTILTRLSSRSLAPEASPSDPRARVVSSIKGIFARVGK